MLTITTSDVRSFSDKCENAWESRNKLLGKTSRTPRELSERLARAEPSSGNPSFISYVLSSRPFDLLGGPAPVTHMHEERRILGQLYRTPTRRDQFRLRTEGASGTDENLMVQLTSRSWIPLDLFLLQLLLFQEGAPLRPGEQLKTLRSRLGITTRDVTEKSQQIAAAEDNEEYCISNAWLTQIENTQATPSIYKLYSLCVIYHLKFTELLSLFGVDLQKIGKYQLSAHLEQTHLTNLEAHDGDRTVTFPVRFDRGFDLEKTNLLSRMVEIWGEIPISLIQHLDVRHSLYGYVGLRDYTLSPLLRPGSFVQIDQKLRKVQSFRWRTEFDRPIYFVELRDGYACSWCELHGNQLLIVPHPLSPCSSRQFVHGTDAEIVGQVTGIAMRIAEGIERSADETPQLPKRS